MESADLEQVIRVLREHRIKNGVDYAFVFKNKRLHVLCHRVYKDSIETELERAGFKEVNWFCFSEH